jgi:hypothetical protein
MDRNSLWALHRAAIQAAIKAGCRGDAASQAHALAWARAVEVQYLHDLAAASSDRVDRDMLAMVRCSLSFLMDREAGQ